MLVLCLFSYFLASKNCFFSKNLGCVMKVGHFYTIEQVWRKVSLFEFSGFQWRQIGGKCISWVCMNNGSKKTGAHVMLSRKCLVFNAINMYAFNPQQKKSGRETMKQWKIKDHNSPKRLSVSSSSGRGGWLRPIRRFWQICLQFTHSGRPRHNRLYCLSMRWQTAATGPW